VRKYRQLNKRITIKDIAKELGVHHSTVSRALRDDPQVNPDTKKKVLETAEKKGYQINMNALQLRGNINNTIALIVPNIRHTFFTNIIGNITNLANVKGYVISIFESNEKYELEREIINTVIKYNFSGVIVSMAKNSLNCGHFKLLKDYGIPLVFFDRMCPDIQSPRVLVNNYESAFQAIELLIGRGYRRIAHVTGPLHLNVFQERQKGYLEALAKHSKQYQESHIINKGFSVDDGKKAMQLFYEKSEKPDAILSSSSVLTIGILLKAKEKGLVIPKDVALISFGSEQITGLIEPEITTIVQPEDKIAEASFNEMLKLLNGQTTNNEGFTRRINTYVTMGNSI
jgi:LacI family transcriptional regulator